MEKLYQKGQILTNLMHNWKDPHQSLSLVRIRALQPQRNCQECPHNGLTVQLSIWKTWKTWGKGSSDSSEGV